MTGTAPEVLGALADLVVVSALGLLVVRPVRWAVGLLVAQAVLIALMAVVAAPGLEGWLAGGLIVATRAVAIPWVLRWAARRTGSADALDLPAPWAWAIGATLVLVGQLALPAFATGLSPAHGALLSTAIVVLLLGLAGMVSGRLLMAQVVHLVVVENGLYCAGLALTGGLPAAMEVGAALDLLLVIFVLAWLSHHVHRLDLPQNVDELSRLRG